MAAQQFEIPAIVIKWAINCAAAEDNLATSRYPVGRPLFHEINGHHPIVIEAHRWVI